MDEFEKKVDFAIRLLRSVGGVDPVEVAYSGGKDSDVILDLVKRSGIKYRAIYRNTTIDPPGTIKHCIEAGAEIHRVPVTFFQLIRRKGLPTRRCRFCCEKMKEYKILDTCVQGIRRAESVKRASRYSPDDYVICRLYGRSRNQHTNIVLPILNWSNEDVERYIRERGIKLHPSYYDENGELVVGNRLGCVTCPLQGDNGLSDFKQRPMLVRTTMTYLSAWWEEHPNTKSHEKFSSPFELFIHNIFSRTYVQHKKFMAEVVAGSDCRSFLERYFSINLHYLPHLRDDKRADKNRKP